MNEILKGNETAKEHQSYPITSGHNLCYAALTSEEETAMIHEITTQLAAKLASDGANSRASMASNPPCHSLAQTLNPGNPSHVSSFYANKYHTASAATAPPSHHQSDISRNSDGLNLAERPAANSNSDVENGRPQTTTKERWLLVCLVLGFVMPLAWVVGGWVISGVDKETEKQLVDRARGWKKRALDLDEDSSSQQSDLNDPQTDDDVPGNNHNTHSNRNNDAQATPLSPSDEPELDLWAPRINLTASAANVAFFPAQYRPFTSMPDLFASSPAVVFHRSQVNLNPESSWPVRISSIHTHQDNL
ncbi:hypothetical protein C366_03226 [Cryptococcus neoformans Tu401-1]|nr:hypothetical protein C366_03226 [Cryptococcus neoformans var. grubii Tu401-1]OXM79692.1 hypothetical protein C364_03194 [Cryptococcus neoformans var. grubii Bt63]